MVGVKTEIYCIGSQDEELLVINDPDNRHVIITINDDASIMLDRNELGMFISILEHYKWCILKDPDETNEATVSEE